MEGPDLEKAVEILDRIMQCELAGVVRYTHYSLMIKGPNRMPLVDFMKAQAIESLQKAIKLNKKKFTRKARKDKDFDSIRSDPAFVSLVGS